MWAERNKLRERPGIAITHIKYEMPYWLFLNTIVATLRHFYKHTEECYDKIAKSLMIG